MTTQTNGTHEAGHSCRTCMFLQRDECHQHAPDFWPAGPFLGLARFPAIAIPENTWCGDFKPAAPTGIRTKDAA